MPDALAPFTAAVEKLSRKDATSVLIALFLVFALVAFGLASVASDFVRLAAAVSGIVSFVVGVCAFAYALLFKPDRLRSDETVKMSMLLEWIQRPDVDDTHRNSAAALLPLLLEGKSGKRASAVRDAEEPKDA